MAVYTYILSQYKHDLEKLKLVNNDSGSFSYNIISKFLVVWDIALYMCSTTTTHV